MKCFSTSVFFIAVILITQNVFSQAPFSVNSFAAPYYLLQDANIGRIALYNKYGNGNNNLIVINYPSLTKEIISDYYTYYNPPNTLNLGLSGGDTYTVTSTWILSPNRYNTAINFADFDGNGSTDVAVPFSIYGNENSTSTGSFNIYDDFSNYPIYSSPVYGLDGMPAMITGDFDND